MKARMLLALALFLLSAPAPDSATIGELSAQLLVVEDNGSLFASDPDDQDTGENHKYPEPEKLD